VKNATPNREASWLYCEIEKREDGRKKQSMPKSRLPVRKVMKENDSKLEVHDSGLSTLARLCGYVNHYEIGPPHWRFFLPTEQCDQSNDRPSPIRRNHQIQRGYALGNHESME
jgi:hypothetical protein